KLQAELENAKLVSGKKETIEQLRVKNESLFELNQQLTNECNSIHDRTSKLQQQLQQVNQQLQSSAIQLNQKRQGEANVVSEFDTWKQQINQFHHADTQLQHE
ncbi:hypothetical protein RFI_31287, partial [Reticulomyxa filosa]